MKRKLQGIGTAFIILLVLLAVLSFLLLRKEESSTKDQENTTYAEKSMKQAKSMSISNEKDHIFLEISNKEIKISGLDHIRLKEEMLIELITSTISLEKLKPMENARMELTLYGLKEPLASVELNYTDGSKFKFQVGNKNKVTNETYLLIESTGQICMAPSIAADCYLWEKKDFISPMILAKQDSLNDFQYIHFAGKNFPKEVIVERTKQGMGFSIVQPYVRNLNMENASIILNSIIKMEADEIAAVNISKETLGEYGLNQCDTEIRVGISTPNSKNMQRATIGAVKCKSGGYYVYNDQQPVIYFVKDAPWIQASYIELVSRLFYVPNLKSLSKMTVSTPKETYSFQIQWEKERLKVSYKDQELKADNFKNYYQLIVSAAHDGDVADWGARNRETLLTITYEFSDDTKSSIIRFLKGSHGTLLVEVEGIIEFTMNDIFVVRVYEETNKVIKNEKVTTDW